MSEENSRIQDLKQLGLDKHEKSRCKKCKLKGAVEVSSCGNQTQYQCVKCGVEYTVYTVKRTRAGEYKKT